MRNVSEIVVRFSDRGAEGRQVHESFLLSEIRVFFHETFLLSFLAENPRTYPYLGQ
jgi:hypothetical protein